MEKPQSGLPRYNMLKHILSLQWTDVFFYVYFCLLIITTKAIIKANVMIVTPIKK